MMTRGFACLGTLILAVLAVVACDRGTTVDDCRSAGGETYLGTLPSNDGCVGCLGSTWDAYEAGDAACMDAYGPELPDGCRAYCKDGLCRRHCPGECRFTPEAGGCEVGEQACQSSWQLNVCDDSCGEAGGCRGCIDNAECEAELGAGAVCQRHCQNCCRPGDTIDGDGEWPCACI
jgi:hypothetical protein